MAAAAAARVAGCLLRQSGHLPVSGRVLLYTGVSLLGNRRTCPPSLSLQAAVNWAQDNSDMETSLVVAYCSTQDCTVYGDELILQYYYTVVGR